MHEEYEAYSLFEEQYEEQYEEVWDDAPYYMTLDSGNTWYGLSDSEVESLAHVAFNTNTDDTERYISTLTEDEVRQYVNATFNTEYNNYMLAMIEFRDRVLDRLRDELSGIWKRVSTNLELYGCISKRRKLSAKKVGKVGVDQLQVRQDLRTMLANKLLVVSTINQILDEDEQMNGYKFDPIARTEAVHTIDALLKAQLEYEMLFVGYLHNHIARWRRAKERYCVSD